MKTYFLLVLFIMQYKEFLTFESVEKSIFWDLKDYAQYCHRTA